MEGEQNRQNFDEHEAPETVWLYRPGVTYPPNTGQQYPIQEGADLQQAHLVETDDMSMQVGAIEPQQVPPQSISGRDTAGPPFQQPHSDNGWTGVQSASGFSNDGMNYFGREHLQTLPNPGNRSQPATGVGHGDRDTGIGRNTELQKRLKSLVKDYDTQREKCIMSFLKIGTGRHDADANGMELKYYTDVDEMVKCRQCGSQAGISDKFHHRDDCVVLKVMKDIGYSSSDDDSLPQRSDSDESMESVEDNTSSVSSRENYTTREFYTAVPGESESTTGFQTFSSDDSLFRSTRGTDIGVPCNDPTVRQLLLMGFKDDRIRAVFEIQGQECLESVELFLHFAEMCTTTGVSGTSNSCASNLGARNLGVSVSGASVSSATLLPSIFTTAEDFSHGRAPVQNFAVRQGGGDVLVPPIFPPGGPTLEVTGAGDVQLDYQYCQACKRRPACVTQEPCGHIVCKTCGDKANQCCKMCKKKVKRRGGFDFASFGS